MPLKVVTARHTCTMFKIWSPFYDPLRPEQPNDPQNPSGSTTALVQMTNTLGKAKPAIGDQRSLDI